MVITLSSSIASTQASSSFLQKAVRSALPSSLARKASPRVQAKMEATGLVDVSLPAGDRHGNMSVFSFPLDERLC